MICPERDKDPMILAVGVVMEALASLYNSAEVKTPVARIVSEMLLLLIMLLFLLGFESDPSSSATASCMFPRRASVCVHVSQTVSFARKVQSSRHIRVVIGLNS